MLGAILPHTVPSMPCIVLRTVPTMLCIVPTWDGGVNYGDKVNDGVDKGGDDEEDGGDK